MKIQDSVFLVTGGASDDYGRATVEKLLKEGAKVVICDSPTKDLIIYADDKAIFLPINMYDEEDTKTLVEVIKEKYGRLNGIVNCIDVHKSIPICDFAKNETHSLNELSTIVHENFMGIYNIVRCTIPLMSRNIPKKCSGRGIIINISNGAEFEEEVIKMTESLNKELQGIQIRSVSIVTNYTKLAHVNGIGSETRPNVIAEDIRNFAELVKTVIEMPNKSSPIIRMESVTKS